MERTLALIVALLVFIPVSTTAADTPTSKAPAPLQLSLSANIAPAPGEVLARVRVERDPRSRSLTIEWWSDEGAGGSHLVNLDGDAAASRQDFRIKRIEPGTYVVRAVLARSDGSVLTKQANLVVVGEGSRFTATGAGTDLMVDPRSRR